MQLSVPMQEVPAQLQLATLAVAPGCSSTEMPVWGAPLASITINISLENSLACMLHLIKLQQLAWCVLRQADVALPPCTTCPAGLVHTDRFSPPSPASRPPLRTIQCSSLHWDRAWQALLSDRTRNSGRRQLEGSC